MYVNLNKYLYLYWHTQTRMYTYIYICPYVITIHWRYGHQLMFFFLRLTPDTVTYNAALSACEKGHWDSGSSGCFLLLFLSFGNGKNQHVHKWASRIFVLGKYTIVVVFLLLFRVSYTIYMFSDVAMQLCLRFSNICRNITAAIHMCPWSLRRSLRRW